MDVYSQKKGTGLGLVWLAYKELLRIWNRFYGSAYEPSWFMNSGITGSPDPF